MVRLCGRNEKKTPRKKSFWLAAIPWDPLPHAEQFHASHPACKATAADGSRKPKGWLLTMGWYQKYIYKCVNEHEKKQENLVALSTLYNAVDRFFFFPNLIYVARGLCKAPPTPPPASYCLFLWGSIALPHLNKFGFCFFSTLPKKATMEACLSLSTLPPEFDDPSTYYLSRKEHENCWILVKRFLSIV